MSPAAMSPRNNPDKRKLQPLRETDTGGRDARGARKDRTGILVLGMHRSGTSAITRVLNLLGAELGDKLMPALAGVNDRGFWEHVDVVEMHNRLLHWHDSNWSDIRSLPSIDLDQGIGQQAVEDARALIRRDFADAALWAIKDPRMSLFAPVWLRAMAGEGIESKIIISVRHPAEVAASLEKRDGLTRGHAYLLWGRHIVEALRASEGRPRAVSDYAGLLRDWRGQLATVADRLGISWPTSPQAAGHAISEFLSEDARHHHQADAGVSSKDPVERCVHQMYVLLARIADGDDEWKQLIQIGEEFERIAETLVPHMAELLKQVWMHAERAGRAEGLIGSKQLEGLSLLSEQMSALQLELAARDERLLSLDRGPEFQGQIDALRSFHEQLGQELRESRDSRIQSLQELVAEKEVRLQAAAEAKRQLESWRDELQLHVNNLEARRTELDSELSASMAHSSGLMAQLAEQGARTAQVQGKLDQSLAHIETLVEERALAQARSQALAEDLVERDAALQLLAAAVAERDAWLQDRTDQLADGEKRMQHATELLSQAQQHVLENRAYAESLEEQMRRITASRCWRYTAMFRRITK